MGEPDWLHNACLLGAHADSNEAPLGTDDFDMLVCARCVTTNAGVRRVMDRWAGVEGRGVMMVDKDNVVLGRTPQEDEVEGEEEDPTELGGETGETLKRKATTADAEATDGPATKKAKIALDSDDSSLADLSSSSAPSTAATEAPDACIAPPAAPDGESILAKLEKDGARMNIYLEEGWIEVRSIPCEAACRPLADPVLAAMVPVLEGATCCQEKCDDEL